MKIETEYKSAFGHICTGGGAGINNSPVNIHFHIHTNDVSIAVKIGRVLNGIIKRAKKTLFF